MKYKKILSIILSLYISLLIYEVIFIFTDLDYKSEASDIQKIIELKNKTAADAIKNLAKSNDLNYTSIEAEAKEIYMFKYPNQQGSIQIPLDSLINVIES